MIRDIDHILIARGAISDRVRELGQAITKHLDEVDADQEIVLVAIMTGSLIFVADLMRHLPMKIRIQLMTASSYIGESTTSNKDSSLGELP
ncbi:MAG TPA: hypothetical protein EYO31_09810, partial [Phycisphaerales bacterium]|nr:hypothetical protein [Phycisphaerales bacterium]